MKICQVCNGHPVDDGRVFHRTCKSLAQVGHEVHLFAVGPGSKEYVHEGVTIHPLPDSGSRRLRYARARKVARRAAALQPDVFHVHEPDLLGPILFRAGSRPVIYDVHESFLDVLSERAWIPKWGRPIARFVWDHLERRLVRKSAAVIVVTDVIARRYAYLHQNVRVIANYPDVETFDLSAPLEQRGMTCVIAGSITPECGIIQVFHAMALLKQRGIGVRLAMAGRPLSDAYVASLLEQAEHLGVRQQVEYQGELSKDEAILFQRAATIGLIITLPFGNCTAGLPNRLVEAMALGLPVVCSNFPVYREVAGSSDAGILVNPLDPESIADAIGFLVRNPDVCRQMGENGKRAVRERFNWSLERHKLFEVYDAILYSSKRR